MTEGAEIRAPATAAAILTQEEQNEENVADAMAEDGANIATHYNGQLPAPTGVVATAVSAMMSTDVQRNQAGDFFRFLTSAQSDFRDLNGDDTFFTALVAVPDTNKVKLI